jgi:outer membrane protein W
MKKVNYMTAVATLCLASFSTHAEQDKQQMLTEQADSGSGHKYALRLLTPDEANTTIGGRMMLNDKTGIDLDFAFNYGSDNEDGVVEGLALKANASYFQYISKGRVSPYYKAGVNFGVFTDDKTGNDDITLSAGIGAEFFIIPEFSLFAEAGLGLAFSPFAIDTGSTQAGLAFYF